MTPALSVDAAQLRLTVWPAAVAVRLAGTVGACVSTVTTALASFVGGPTLPAASSAVTL